MGVLLQGFFQQNNDGVPSPGDGDPGGVWWWDHLAAQANAFRLSGFSAIWLPPMLKGSSGIQSMGYDVFDDYDLGAKNQKGTIPTRYGSRQQLQRCVAVLRANGIDVYLDIVNHQRDGGDDFVYTYLGAGGVANAGRFPKSKLDFHPNVPPDPNVFDTSISFGDDLATVNCIPTGYVSNGLIDACDWLTRALDVQGYRFDDAKGISTDFTLALATSKSMAGKFVVGELISPVDDIAAWVFNGMEEKVSAFDYPLHFLIAGMCNNPGQFDMTQLDNSGFTAIAPGNAVTFVENHDTDNNAGLMPVVRNKMLGYAFILTIEGYPSVYYRDYSLDANCYGLKPGIDTLIWIHENLAAGNTVQRWKDFDVFAYERLGTPGLLVGLNNDPSNPHTIVVATNFGPGTALHDYAGHAADVTTADNGSVTITIPPNSSGESYVCYSRAGITAAFKPETQSVTQDFDAAADLDILPATNGATTEVGAIWCAAGSQIELALIIDRTNWTNDTAVTVHLMEPGPEGLSPVSEMAVKRRSAIPAVLRRKAGRGADRFYTLQVHSTGLPAAAVPFRLTATYTASQIFKVENVKAPSGNTPR